MGKMKKSMLKKIGLVVFTMLMVSAISFPAAYAGTAQEIDQGADLALQKLYESSPAAKELAKIAKGILIFPDIVKGGLIIGGQYGEGALRIGGKTTGYYKSVAASYGLQAGVQKFGYALFFMTDSSLEYLKKSEGWEIGVGPTLVVVDEGVATSLTTTTAKSDIYAFFFSQQGLMAGIGIQGSKITRVEK